MPRSIWVKENFVKYYPVVATVIFEIATIGQILRMFSEQSAAGQEPLSWLLVTVGLSGWMFWYKITIPDHKLVFYSVAVGTAVNSIAFITCVYFKYFH